MQSSTKTNQDGLNVGWFCCPFASNCTDGLDLSGGEFFCGMKLTSFYVNVPDSRPASMTPWKKEVDRRRALQKNVFSSFSLQSVFISFIASQEQVKPAPPVFKIFQNFENFENGWRRFNLFSRN